MEFNALLNEHMRKEDDLLERARGCLAEEGWSGIVSAFTANDDPLFGNARCRNFANCISAFSICCRAS